LKVLIWAVNSENNGSADFQEEVQEITGALKRLGNEVQVDGPVLAGGPYALLQELRKGYHVLHYIGQGKFEGEGKLAFQAQAGSAPIWVTADQIRPGLEQNSTLQLVFLNSPTTAVGAAGNAYSS